MLEIKLQNNLEIKQKNVVYVKSNHQKAEQNNINIA
jgi:hypothetical protein